MKFAVNDRNQNTYPKFNLRKLCGELTSTRALSRTVYIHRCFVHEDIMI